MYRTSSVKVSHDLWLVNDYLEEYRESGNHPVKNYGKKDLENKLCFYFLQH